MTADFSKREKIWEPAPRPEWVERINAEGRGMDSKSVVPLDEQSLIEHAKANTGLSDFGEDDWYEPFKVLIKALDEEAELNLMGRLMTRSEMLNYLEQRLQIEDTYKRHPEIEDQEIVKPLMIIGQGRSGTSVLQNLLSQDPDCNALLYWLMYFPCPPPEAKNLKTDPRIEIARHRVTQISRVVPEVTGMYEFGAEIPFENSLLHSYSFRSSIWFTGFGGRVPGYNDYLASQDPTLPFLYEKRILKLLQWKNPRHHWVFKSPAIMVEFSTYLEVFPDVRLVWIHRDPVKALSSMVNLHGTMVWSRTDSPTFSEAEQTFTNAEFGAEMLTAPIELMESGVIPEHALCNVQYQDFMQDPVKVAAAIYNYFDMPFTDAAHNAMSQYMCDNPRSSRPKHEYKLGDAEQIRVEREAYKRYQEYFNVPNEI